MLILALDTTSEYGGVAIYRDTDCLARILNEGPANTYSVTLFHMVDRALAEASERNVSGRSQDSSRQFSLGDIELFAVANGPGSFTGIRVGLAAAQGWATALHRLVTGVPVLDAMVELAKPGTEWAVPILDARRGEFFLRLFRRQEGDTNFRAEGEGLVMMLPALRSFFEDLVSRQRAGPGGIGAGGTITCLVRDSDRVAQALRESLPNGLLWQNVPANLLAGIAQHALRAHKEGNLGTPADLDACYIRRSDAEFQVPKDQR